MDSTVSREDLALAFKERLQRMGKLDDIRASLRSEVFQCLQNSQQKDNPESDKLHDRKCDSDVVLPIELELCHGLILEYLQCSGLVHTLSTYRVETSVIHSSGQLTNNERLMRRMMEELYMCHSGEDKDAYRKDTPYQGKKRDTIPLLFRIVRNLHRRCVLKRKNEM